MNEATQITRIVRTATGQPVTTRALGRGYFAVKIPGFAGATAATCPPYRAAADQVAAALAARYPVITVNPDGIVLVGAR